MSRAAIRFLIAAMCVGVVVGQAAAAFAADVAIAVTAPTSVHVGDWVEITATVTADGAPVRGAVVTLSYEEQFIGERAFVEVGTEVTGSDGVAVFRYQQRDPDGEAMRVSYEGPDPNVTVAPLVFDLPVEPGSQQFRPRAGVRIPWLNGWVLVGLVVIVWGTIVVAAAQLVRIGRDGRDRRAGTAMAAPAGEEGSTWLGTAITAAVVVIALIIVTVLVRNPPTHANLGSPEGYTRTPVAYVDQPVNYRGPGVDAAVLAATSDDVARGRALFFGAGCAGCHLVDGSGGVVGPKLRPEDVTELTRDVRRGPGGMPAYNESVLSNDDLALMFAYLRAGTGGNPGG
jgi:Cytochrome c, mono- and diheme variants